MKKTIAPLMTCAMAVAAMTSFAETIEIHSEVAGMSWFRKFWDAPLMLSEEGERKQEDTQVTEWGKAAVWDGENPGVLAFDAVNRRLLVRFPGAAEAIAEKLAAGFAIAKAEIVLTHVDEELWPLGGGTPSDSTYVYQKNWGCEEAWRAVRPNWHAEAYALRKPWKADAEVGPTFNAAVNGKVYWKRWGATDVEADRFAAQFGPTEVSVERPEGRMDVTALLTDAAFGASLGERLRLISDCGFIVSKWEVYDHRYFEIHYEWTTASGCRAIIVKAPTLSVTFRSKVEGGKVEGMPLQPSTFDLPPAADVAAMAQGQAVGAPTAVLASPAEVEAMNAKFLGKPEWMPQWQYDNVRDLFTKGASFTPLAGEGRMPPFYYQLLGPVHYVGLLVTKLKRENPEVSQAEIDYEVYKLWVDMTLARSPRFWLGHLMCSDGVTLWNTYREALVGPALDHFMLNWWAWLMPDRKTAENRQDWEALTGDLIHPQAEWSRKTATSNEKTRPQGMYYYYEQTGDWRGNRSYPRSGYTRSTSTQNFNHSSTAGALLLGQALDSEYAMADGRWGLRNKLFWLWAYGHGGVGQEYVDHYYWSITMADVKLFPDFAQRLDDKMLGWGIVSKHIEDLAGAYHPNLRRIVGPSGRTMINCVFGSMEGINSILHVLSRKGALTDMETRTLPAISSPDRDRYPIVGAWGHDFPPLSVARQSLAGPWADPWMSEIVDEKPIPWSLHAQQHGFGLPAPAWITTYFGENYGLASIVSWGGHRYHAFGQWRRKRQTPDSMTQIGTLDARMGFNDPTAFVKGLAVHGSSQPFGIYRTYQHKNKAILLAKPNMALITNVVSGTYSYGGETPPKEEITSLQYSAAFFTFEDPAPTYALYLDRQKIETLPVTARYGQVITLKDGVSYVALRPLGGVPEVQKFRSSGVQNDAVTIARGEEESPGNNKAICIRPELIVNAYLFKRETPLAEDEIDTMKETIGGFIVELGDETEYGNFAAFQAAMLAATCDIEGGEGRMKVTYASDGDTLVADWTPEKDGDTAFTVNGASPYPAKDVWRDSPLTKMAKSGNLAKSGATIERTGGDEHLLLLQTFPKQGIYVAMNPVPNYQSYAFTTPDGVKITADGLLSMGRWAVKGATELDIRYCAFEGEDAFNGAAPAPADQRATSLLVTGMKDTPAITLNGHAITPVKEGNAWRIPL